MAGDAVMQVCGGLALEVGEASPDSKCSILSS